MKHVLCGTVLMETTMDDNENRFPESEEYSSRSPKSYPVNGSCFEDAEKRSRVESFVGGFLRLFGPLHFDLEALDGATFATDTRATAIAIQKPPDISCIPPDTIKLPNTLELARTIAVWRGDRLCFHVVMHADIGEMFLSEDKAQQALAIACLGHELAHVQHEGRFYRKFPSLYHGPLECGSRNRSVFIQAMDVWSEYAACRSSAALRPEGLDEHQLLLLRAIEKMLTIERTALPEENIAVAAEMLLCAGYLLGELDGLELEIEFEPRQGAPSLPEHAKIISAISRLKGFLRELWQTEEDWPSVDVFVPIYELMLEFG
jgi:hypothetical protein